MTQMLPPKKDVALALLERSNVDVYLDPRAEGVVVPPQFRKEPQLILKVGLNMPLPIPDLRVDDDSMTCTLSFSRVPFFCVVPWSSVFAMVGEDGRGMVWPDDVPRELSVKMVDESNPKGRAPAEDAPPEAPAPRGRGRTKLVDASARPGPRSLDEARAGAKRAPSKRKKKEPARPTLVAVPPPAPSGPSVSSSASKAGASASSPVDAAVASKAPSRSKSAADKSRVAPEAAPSAGAPSAGAPSAGANGSGLGRAPSRPKRELPPYLRVVK